MSALDLYVDDIDGRLHAAVVRKTVLTDLYADPKTMTGSWASLYLGKVTKIDKSLDAAIVDLGNGLSGLLSAKHVHFPGADRSEARTGIADLLKPGQTVVVQIKSEAKAASAQEHQKLARLTMQLNILGQYLIYCPVASQVTISRRIGSESTLAFTAKLKGRGGWIVQPAAEDAAEEAIHAETARLQEDWHVIQSEKETSGGKPRLLKAGPNALSRVLFDYSESAFGHIHVGSKKILDLMTAWCEKHSPSLATSKRLRLFKPEKPGQALFDLHDLHAEIEALKERRVELPSGGSIVIEHTSALTVIDVNQGSSGNIATANLEAAREAARQTRLRNLSGVILVDFIGQTLRTDRAKLQDELEKSFADDHAMAQMHGFTRLGIAEIARKRRSAPLREKEKS